MKSSGQEPIAPSGDLRDMLRRYLILRSLECMERAASRREETIRTGDIDSYRQRTAATLRGFYGKLPVGGNAGPLNARLVSTHERVGYRLENVLFESFPGWEVNATVYIPTNYQPPFKAVVVPVGHSGKQFPNYQMPCQFFSRSGYLAIVFDPPGMSGEKTIGNDHFVDGVRCYLVGDTSSRYFVADALRCIDYLETREDVDVIDGVAMTGVSGGGTTTMLSNLLDERIAVVGPSCCATSIADLDILQCYAGCPETKMWRRYAEEIDDIDLICAAYPKPMLLMAGRHDEVFRIEDVRKLADDAEKLYSAAGIKERFEFFEDDHGHGYSVAQAARFVGFMDQWLRPGCSSDMSGLSPDAFSLEPAETLRCHPSQDANMRSLTFDTAESLEKSRCRTNADMRRAVAEIAGVMEMPPVPEHIDGESFRVFTHVWKQLILKPEPGIELPTTFLHPHDRGAAPAIVHFDDQGRNKHLQSGGLLTKAINLFGKDRRCCIVCPDLRGWGDSAPSLYPYELVSWGSVDRCLAYMSNALGDPLMAMRIRDALSVLEDARSREEVMAERIVLSGSGLGGIVALHAAALDRSISGVVVWDTIESFISLLEGDYQWPADIFIPNVLKHYDLPDLIASLDCPVRVINPLGPDKKLVDMDPTESGTYCVGGADVIVRELQAMLWEC